MIDFTENSEEESVFKNISKEVINYKTIARLKVIKYIGYMLSSTQPTAEVDERLRS